MLVRQESVDRNPPLEYPAASEQSIERAKILSWGISWRASIIPPVMMNADWFRRIPWSLAVCTVALMALGLTGIARGDELAHAGEFFDKQVVWIALAVPAMLLATLVPYRF